jgi:hypothetical protein
MNTPEDYSFEDTRIKMNGEYAPCPLGLGIEHVFRRVRPGDTMKCPCCDKLFTLIIEQELDFPIWRPEPHIKK